MGGFSLSFRVQGRVYYLVDSTVPSVGESPKFSKFILSTINYV